MRLSHDQRVAIITLRNEGWSYRKLALRFHVRKATVIAQHEKYSLTGSVDDLHGRGRKKHSTIVERIVSYLD